jgi:integral membrane sensor domain MASE1
MAHRDIWFATALVLCNAGETILAAWLIERYFGSVFSLDSLRNVLGLVAAAVVANATSAVGATVAYSSAQQRRFGSLGIIGLCLARCGAILTITWQELGGPPIAAPVPSGYGLSLYPPSHSS